MSKRVANCRGRTTARFGRVRIGWKKQRMISELERLDKAFREGNIEEDMLAKMQDFKDRAKRTLGKFMPKRIFRHQSR